MPVVIIGGLVLLARLIFGAPFGPKGYQEVILVQGKPNPSITIIDKRKSLLDVLYPWAIAFWIGYFTFYYLSR